MTSLYSTIKQNIGKKYKIVLILFFIVLVELFDKTAIYDTNNKFKDECLKMKDDDGEYHNRTRTGNTPIQALPKLKVNHKARKKMFVRRRQCTFYDPLINKSNPIFCATQNFVSLVRSKCKTRLGKLKYRYILID